MRNDRPTFSLAQKRKKVDMRRKQLLPDGYLYWRVFYTLCSPCIADAIDARHLPIVTTNSSRKKCQTSRHTSMNTPWYPLLIHVRMKILQWALLEKMHFLSFYLYDSAPTLYFWQFLAWEVRCWNSSVGKGIAFSVYFGNPKSVGSNPIQYKLIFLALVNYFFQFFSFKTAKYTLQNGFYCSNFAKNIEF